MPDLDFGPCCCCGKEGPDVRNIYQLAYCAPVPGTGWGCIICEIPPDGAVAVVCDKCHETRAPLLFVVSGFIPEKGRVPLAQLTEKFNHDLLKHTLIERASALMEESIPEA